MLMVPFPRRVAALGLLFACGQTALGDRTEVERPRAFVARPHVVTVTASVTAPVPPPPQGPLANPAALKHFFEALSRLEDGSATEDVRVVQFGDSHTAADLMTGVARRALQARFGDGGRGFVALGRPWRTYFQEGLKDPGMTRDWNPEHGKLEHGRFVGDGCYGLAGVCLVTSSPGARAWSEIATPFSRVEVDYWEQPSGGSFDLLVDGAAVGTVKTRGAQPTSAFQGFDVADGPHRIEVRAHGDGDVRVFGVSLDRARVGLVYDALGLNGARASTTLHWNEAHMAEQLRHRAPDLVVLAYGTNESADDLPLDVIERQLVDALGRVARAVPASSCLIMGPPDRAVSTASDNPYETRDAGGTWATARKLEDVVALERRVAGAAGCAFYDELAAMGGPGTIAAWAEQDPPRAQRDRVHLTREGYAELGTTFAHDMVAAYAATTNRQPAPLLPAPRELRPVPPSQTAVQAPFVAVPL